MAYVNTAATNVRSDAQGFFADLAERYAKYRVYRTTLNELRGLSDRELADLALSRSMLRSIAYEAAYKA